MLKVAAIGLTEVQVIPAGLCCQKVKAVRDVIRFGIGTAGLVRSVYTNVVVNARVAEDSTAGKADVAVISRNDIRHRQ